MGKNEYTHLGSQQWNNCQKVGVLLLHKGNLAGWNSVHDPLESGHPV